MFKKIFISILCIFSMASVTLGEQTTTLQAGISLVDKVPKAFFGTWRVKSELVSTNNEGIFKPTSLDLWNLSKVNNVITLDNPFSGAHASITLDEVSNTLIKFKKTGDYDNKKLTDIVQLKLEGDKFYGTNYLILETISNVDNSILKTERATYKLTGEKISGSSIK